MLSIALSALISYIPLIMAIKSLTSFFVPEDFVLDTLFLYLVLIFFLIYGFIVITKSIKIDSIVIYLIFIIIFAMSYLIFPDNRVYMFGNEDTDLFNHPIIVLFIFTLPAYAFARGIKDWKIFIKVFYVFSVLVIIGGVVNYAILISRDLVVEYMSFSYNLTLQTTFVIAMFIRNKKITSFIVGILGLVTIILIGARGPVVSIGISVILYIIFKEKRLLSVIRSVLLIVVLMSIVLIFYDDILRMLISVASNFGIESRTLALILEGNIASDSGRIDIYYDVLANISFLPQGFFGDRALLGGSYAHNILLEFTYQFGFLFGGIIVVALIFLIAKGIVCMNADTRLIIIVFLSTGFVKLMLSGSYLNQEPALYALVGFCVSSKIYVKEKDSDENSLVV